MSFLSLVTNEFPLFFPVVAFVSGQLWGGAAVFCAFILYIFKREQIIVFVIVCSSMGCVHHTLLARENKQTLMGFETGSRYAAIVSEELRYSTPGRITVPVKILGVLSDSKGFEPLKEPVYAYCKGRHLPWMNTSLLKHGMSFVFDGSLTVLAPEKSGFDSYLRVRGFQYFCTLRFVAPGHAESTMKDSLYALISRLVQHVYGNSEEARVFLAMVFGVKDGLTRETFESFRRLGMLHLLVLSGLQLSVVCITVEWLVGLSVYLWPSLVRVVHVRTCAIVCSCVLLTLLVWCSGSGYSGLRALFAAYAGGWLRIIGRRTNQLSVILFAFFILCLLWPGCIRLIGVQFTFVALLQLCSASFLMKFCCPAGSWRAGLFTSLSCMCGTSFLSMYHFSSCSPVGFLVGFFFMWAFPFVVVKAGVIIFVVCAVGKAFIGGGMITNYFSSGVVILIGTLINLCEFLSRLKYSFLEVTTGGRLSLLVVFGGLSAIQLLVSVCLYVMRKQKKDENYHPVSLQGLKF